MVDLNGAEGSSLGGSLRRRPGDPTDLAFIAEFRRRGQNYAKAMPTPEPVLAVDFFAGAGGMSSGFQATRQSGLGFQHLAAVDIDAQALETLRTNLGIRTLELDVWDLADDPDLLVSHIPELTPSPRRPPLVFIGCPPCQGFSAHRKKDDRDDPRNSLIMAFARLVTHFRPDVIAMENVPEMIKGRFQHYYEAAASELRTSGYRLTESIVDMSLYGVPQRRRRAVVLGSLTSEIRLPDPPLTRKDVRTVRDAIAHLPVVGSGATDPEDPWHRAPNHIPRILAKIERVPPDGGDRRSLPTEEQLACHMDVDAGATPGFTDVYGRLRWDAPSVTITAKSSTPSCGRFLHPEQHRNITVREAALLQTFPHNYVFTGGFVGQYRQIGEAVPPLFARFLAHAVLDHLRPVPREVFTVRARIASVMGRQSQTRDQLAAVDLFAGAGGLSLGLAAAGFRPVYAVDNDEAAVRSYQKNIGSHAAVSDVRDESIIQRIASAADGSQYIIAGGPPCQGFSQQRRGDNADHRNDLVLRYAEIVELLPERPLAVVLENVMYLDSPRGRRILAQFLERLARLGYVMKRLNLHAANFGLPQTRQRIVLVGIDATAGAELAPLDAITHDRWVTIGESLVGLDVDPSDAYANHVGARESHVNIRRMAYVDMGRGRTAIPEDLQLNCHVGYDGHLDVFGRLDWFGFARTITGGFDSASRGEYGHPFKNRSITAREAARIQGFPDSFEFQGNKAEVRRQIGNAVPPPLAYAIGDALQRTIR